MDTVRDPARVDPWRASLERSIARRRRERRRSDSTSGPRLEHGAVPSYWALCCRALVGRPMAVVTAAAATLTIALLAATRPIASSGQEVRSVAHSVRPHRPHPIAAATPRHCRISEATGGYRNPFAHANVTGERIDQGIDYKGSGAIGALGTARITHVATENTGWPGAFIEYQLLSGASAGCFVYYAEGLTPVAGLHVGETVGPGQAVALILPGTSTGIEIGWGAGDGAKSYAAAHQQWSSAHEDYDIPSAAGVYFSALLAALGGPPGRVEG